MLTKRAGAVAAWLAGAAMVVGFGPPARSAVGPVTNPSMNAVWCSSPRHCLAVGQDENFEPISAVWNGGSWRFVNTPAPGGGLVALGCSGWHTCMALGSRHGVIDEWNGAAWKKLSTPSANLLSVACPDPHRCLAVGSTLYATRRSAALVWNGMSWRRVPVPRPAHATSSAFTSVACAGPADCLAVGSYNLNGLDGLHLAMRWDGSRWRQVAAPPYLNRGDACASQTRCTVSCVKTGRCIAVGDGTSLIWNGHTWRKVAVPGGVDDELAGISCSGSFCLAVGFTSAFAWNGRKWSTLPATGLFNAGVWCIGRSACMAVGSSAPPFDLGISASSWKGRSWMPLRLSKFEELDDVSCTPPESCIAVGDTNSLPPGTDALAERLSGSVWQVMAGPNISPQGISCTSTRFCMVVSVAGARRWNGSRWIATNLPAQTPDGVVIAAVSCTSASDCVVVIGDNDWVWNGKSWRENSAAISGDDVALTTVSCASATMCMALGYDQSSSCVEGCNVNLLAEQWDGSTWSISENTHYDIYLPPVSSVSCPSTTFCVQVTDSTATSWDGHTWTKQTASLTDFVAPSLSCGGTSNCVVVDPLAGAAEVWNGTAWRATHLASGATVNAVSCSAPNRCVAVGQNADLLTLAESWDGTAWKLLPTINP